VLNRNVSDLCFQVMKGLSYSTEGDLKILSTERIEQSAVPLCMAWYPMFTNETFLLTTNNEVKFWNITLWTIKIQ